MSIWDQVSVRVKFVSSEIRRRLNVGFKSVMGLDLESGLGLGQGPPPEATSSAPSIRVTVIGRVYARAEASYRDRKLQFDQDEASYRDRKL